MYVRQSPERKLKVELGKRIEREPAIQKNCNEPAMHACILHVQNDPLFHYRGLRYCIDVSNKLLPSMQFSGCGYHKYWLTYGK